MAAIQYVYIFSGVAILVIIIACINFMNLATARYERRAKEVGVRKVIGADRRSLITQFLGESIFMSALALGLAVALISLLLPSFNTLSGKSLSLSSINSQQVGRHPHHYNTHTGLAAGIYPALFLSSFKPVSVLKSSRGSAPKGASFRNFLVITQFVISVFLIIGTLTIGAPAPLHSVTNAWASTRIISSSCPPLRASTRIQSPTSPETGHPLRPSLNPTALLTNVSSSSSDYTWEGKSPSANILFHNLAVGYDFPETFHIRVTGAAASPRNFSNDTASYIINEEALRQMNLKDPIGKKLPAERYIGVVQDFNFKSVHSPYRTPRLAMAGRRNAG